MYNQMVVRNELTDDEVDRIFQALADSTRRDIVVRVLRQEQSVSALAGHYRMSFAAVQKHVAVLERAGLVHKHRIGRRKVVRTNLEGLRVARRLLDGYEELWVHGEHVSVTVAPQDRDKVDPATRHLATPEERWAATMPIYEQVISEGWLKKIIPAPAGGDAHGVPCGGGSEAHQ